MKMEQNETESEEQIIELAHRLIRENRATCLWFLREDFMPVKADDLIRAMDAIMGHGALQSYRDARRVREWFSQKSSEKSAV